MNFPGCTTGKPDTKIGIERMDVINLREPFSANGAENWEGGEAIGLWGSEGLLF